MATFLLLKHYSGDGAPMPDWTPDEMKAHIRFQQELIRELAEAGELVRADGLAGPELAKLVRFGGPDAPPAVTDGPFPEAKEFLAGYYMIDVDTAERAYEIAAKASSAPGPNGDPIYEGIEVRQIMGAPDPDA
jgi:hypothetical protein